MLRTFPAPWVCLVWLCGCAGAGVLTSPGGGAGGDDDTTPDGDDDVADDDVGDDDAPLEQVPGAGDVAAALFGLDQVHTVEIELPPDSRAALEAWPAWFTHDLPYDYVPAAVVIDGERLDEVAVRLKGRWGSYRGMGGKAAFKIDLNRYVPGQTYLGQEKLTLNNMLVDCSMAKEALALEVYRARGLVVPRMAYAWVTVDGEPFGLYALVETIDDAFLDAHFSHPDGNLYEPEYIVYPDGSYLLVDFEAETVPYFQLEEGDDVGRADVAAVTMALDAHAGTAQFTPEVGALLDLELARRLFAVEQWVGQNDGYALNINNYFVYFDPADGKARFVPWDLDYSFLYAADWGFDWRYPSGRVAASCWADDTCFAGFLDEVETTCAVADDLDLAGRLDQIAALTSPYVIDDPRRECTLQQMESYRSWLRWWFEGRSAEVRGGWGL